MNIETLPHDDVVAMIRHEMRQAAERKKVIRGVVMAVMLWAVSIVALVWWA